MVLQGLHKPGRVDPGFQQQRMVVKGLQKIREACERVATDLGRLCKGCIILGRVEPELNQPGRVEPGLQHPENVGPGLQHLGRVEPRLCSREGCARDTAATIVARFQHTMKGCGKVAAY